MFGSNFTANSDLPLVLDESPGFPIRELFDGVHKEVVILGYEGEILGRMVMNFNSINAYIAQMHDLIAENYSLPILPGDVNDDGVVNIQDIIMVIGSILGTVDLGDNESLADVDQDGTVDILDIVQIINIILNG